MLGRQHLLNLQPYLQEIQKRRAAGKRLVGTLTMRFTLQGWSFCHRPLDAAGVDTGDGETHSTA